MAKANEIKRGTVVELNGKMLIVKDIEIHSPTARGATTLYKMRFNDIVTGSKVEERFKGEDNLNIITLLRRAVSFSYIDGDEYIFMDNEDYTPYSFKQDQIAEELLFIPEEGLPGLNVLMVEDKIIGLELPQTVEMEIIETAPALKGASATSRSKPAKMKTGLTISVPEYLSTGEKICIHISEKRYMGRAE